jgi:hypothetical protein
MKTPSHDFLQKFCRILRSVVGEPNYKHEKCLSGSDLLINRLTAFNFRPPLIFPGQELARISGSLQ